MSLVKPSMQPCDIRRMPCLDGQRGCMYHLLHALHVLSSYPCTTLCAVLSSTSKYMAEACMQVRVAYTPGASAQVQRNNYQLIKLFVMKWRKAVPLPLKEITAHLSAQIAANATARQRQAAFQQRSMGMKLLAAGSLHLGLPFSVGCRLANMLSDVPI